ncbi:hypothetical protein Rhopal_007866-T1 [Rhodotorula paludigena]|uniref:Uncharacterized protein n=1 Tax=Rhodotorula paludigena TaxID=86838 RepID=A0AAV5GZX9_9BASI|nr:hypothetical protein Rhopal_007866-T1 [Rhodotorula paludigena]
MRNQFGLPAYPTELPDPERKRWNQAFEAAKHPDPQDGVTGQEILAAIRAQINEEKSAQAAGRQHRFNSALIDYINNVNTAAHSWLNGQPGAAAHALGKMQGEGHYRRRFIYEGVRP